MGFVATDMVKQSKPSERAKLDFNSDCHQIMIKFVDLITEKSPLKYSLTRHLSCLNPKNIRKVSGKVQQSSTKFNKVLKCMDVANWVQTADCEIIIGQFSDFVLSVEKSEQFKSFDAVVNRIDTLFFDTMKEFDKLWSVTSKLLLLSHGQGRVERGFSINKETSEVHHTEESLVARRKVKDNISAGGGIQNVLITQDLLTSGLHAYRRYADHLEEKKKECEREQRACKRKPLEDELDTLKKIRLELKLDEERLVKESCTACDKAEATGNLTVLAKGNCLRNAAKQKKEGHEQVAALIKEKEALLNNM